MRNESNPRAAAFASLLSWEKNGRFANLEVNTALQTSAMSDADKGLYTALVYGVIERAITLDYIIGTLSSRPLAQIDRETRCALRLGLYQLTFMDRIPPHAAVSESVGLASAKSRGFVNALLRTYLRGGCRYELPAGDALTRMEIEFSAPRELCAFFCERYGEDTAKALLSCANLSPAVSIRPNPLRTTAEEILARHAADGARICPLSPDMVEIDHASGVAAGIAEGLYFVQDPASRLCVRALDAREGETVIDTCAAPGGKSISAALDMRNHGRLIAFDLHENKLSLIRRTAQSLGITILETASRDARTPDPAQIGQADRVLCDAPCSGLGVIRKKPDIRYKSLESVAALPAIQYDILCGAAQYVRPGGVLVYSTCTLNPDENEHIVRRFLAENPAFTAEDFDLGPAGVSEGGMRTFFPHLEGCDGFFIAKMTRKAT